eukprot:Awhi_evm1s10958
MSEVNVVERERWGSRLSFILAAIGSAIGLGNFWRFPFLVYKWGGGSFFIPYFISLIVLGIPMLILELSIGQVFQSAAVAGMSKVNKRYSGLGLAGATASFLICCYYCVVMGWSLIYLVESFFPTLPWSIRGEADVSNADNHFLYDTLNLSSSISDTKYIIGKIFFAVVVQWICVYLCLWKGVKATGKVVYVTMLVPLVMLFILLIRGVTLEGASNGIYEYVGKWDMSNLAEGQMWVDASTQIFFSLSLAFGVMQAYGSFNEPNSNVVQNAIIIAVSNCSFSFLTGFVVFSIIGHLTHIQNIPFDSLTVGGPGLAFVTYPAALSLMPGVSANIFCVIFFLTFFMLGIDSAFSMVEGIVANLQETKLLGNVSRSSLLIWTCVLGCFGSMLYAADFGYYMLDLVDFYINNFCLLVIVLMEAYSVGFGHDRKGLVALVGKKAATLFELCATGGILVITVVVFITWEYTSMSISYGIGFGALGCLMLFGLGMSIHFGAQYVKSNRNEVGNKGPYASAAYLLMFHQPNTFGRVLNQAITNGEDSEGNWKVNILWSGMVKFVVPCCCIILLAFTARTLGRDQGYGGYPVGFQILGTLVMLFICSFIPLGMARPDLVIKEETEVIAAKDSYRSKSELSVEIATMDNLDNGLSQEKKDLDQTIA